MKCVSCSAGRATPPLSVRNQGQCLPPPRALPPSSSCPAQMPRDLGQAAQLVRAEQGLTRVTLPP